MTMTIDRQAGWRCAAAVSLLAIAAPLGCGDGRGGRDTADYRGTEPPLAVSLDYPPSWRLVEERGRAEPYAAVRVLGPRNAEDTYTAYMTVRGWLVPGEAGRMEEIDGRVHRYTSQLLDGSAVESDMRRRQWGTDVRDLTVAYTVPPLHRAGLKPVQIPVRTRTLFLRRGEYAYEVSYSADAREYASHQDAFDELLASLRFR